MLLQKTNSRIDKDASNDKSLKLLLRSVQLDDNDHLAFYYLALQYMHLGMLNEAMVSPTKYPSIMLVWVTDCTSTARFMSILVLCLKSVELRSFCSPC